MMNNIKHFRKSLLTGAAFALLLSAGQVMATDVTSVVATTPIVQGTGTVVPPATQVTSCVRDGTMLDLKCVITALMQTLNQTLGAANPPV